MIKTIGVLTSGGDSPGMNAAIRAIVKAAWKKNVAVKGIVRGYSGLVNGHIIPLNLESVSGIIQRGGTILKSARCKEFHQPEYRKIAYDHLKKENIDALIVIGGDGTFTGASIFSKEFDIPVVGLAGTIDNDLYGTDFTIGYDTAINTAVQAIDKIRDTADSHDRLFIVEVMGKDAGFIALRSGIASGAEAVLIPESDRDSQHLFKLLEQGFRKEKRSIIVVVAEGDESGGALALQENLRQNYPDFDIRTTILGHLQRGGAPSAADRVLASSVGVEAVNAVLDGKKNCMIGYINGKLEFTDFSKSIKHHDKLNLQLVQLSELLGS